MTSLPVDPDLLVGLNAPDDAAVVRLPGAPHDAPALVLTTDFFTPIVDDARTFGRIAAINAMSDVYAMGGTPRFALNLAGFPTKTVSLEILAQILAGGAEACRDEGVLVVGGHTVDDPEPKFGLAVIGTVEPTKVWRKQGARVGDVLVLTKALGTGVIATAFKREAIAEDDAGMRAAITSMTTPNRRAAELARPFDIHAATDVTGYGLIGHLLEMLRETKVDAELRASSVPLLPRAHELAIAGNIAGGSAANAAFGADRCTFAEAVDAATRTLLSDAQTSGGLLLAMRRADAEAFVAAFGAPSAIVGAFVEGDGRVRVR